MAIEGVFGALPTRAFVDTRLSATDFRVLGAIASHDQGNANGRGCFASSETLMRESALRQRSSLSESIGRLMEFGYLTARPHPTDNRKRVYAVKYRDNSPVVRQNPNDSTASPPAVADRSAKSERSGAPDEIVRLSREIVRSPIDEFPDNSNTSLCKRSRRDSAEAGIDLAEARAFNGSTRLQWNEMLDRISRVIGVNREVAGNLAMEVIPAEEAELEATSTSDERVAEIAQGIADRQRQRARQ